MKKIKKIYLVLVIILILIVFYIIRMDINNKENNNTINKENEISNELDKEIEEMNKSNVGNIDKENLINAKLEDQKKINNSSELMKDKQFENIQICNIKLKEKNGLSNITADVYNKSENIFKEKNVKIIFLNENNEEISNITVLITDIQPNNMISIDASITEDIINAYDFKIENVK